ncbi:unnamed protein product [Owenia fusiformis]|uniref:Uncharacterized protein n=1 Tax=Owenia fusiformis TaxID=6347 RepID=A0A8S4PWS2_OWEFU|nr:unnamed protein product [Owenia fusiformis]
MYFKKAIDEHIAKHIGQVNASIPKITYVDLSNDSEVINSISDLMSLDTPVSSVMPSLLSSEDQEVEIVQGKEKTNEPRQDIDIDMDSGWDSFARLSPLGHDILKKCLKEVDISPQEQLKVYKIPKLSEKEKIKRMEAAKESIEVINKKRESILGETETANKDLLLDEELLIHDTLITDNMLEDSTYQRKLLTPEPTNTNLSDTTPEARNKQPSNEDEPTTTPKLQDTILDLSLKKAGKQLTLDRWFK